LFEELILLIPKYLDFTTLPYTIIVSYSHLNYPVMIVSDVIILYYSIIKSGFLFMLSAQPSILNEVNVMLDKSWGQRFALTGDGTPVFQSSARAQGS